MNSLAAISYPKTKGDRETQLLRRIMQLEQERDDAVAELAEVKAAFGLVPDTELRVLGLTPTQAAVVSLLMKRDMATHEQIRFAIFQDAGERAERCDNNVKVQICKARRCLTRFGVSIDPIWGKGYRLTEESKARLREVMETA